MTASTHYISTRGETTPVGFTDAVLMGLATDGGLLLPERVPDVSAELDKWVTLSYPELAAEIIRIFVGGELPQGDLADVVRRSYAGFRHSDVVAVQELGGRYILELFHGPTLAFKDVALQFLGNLFEYILQQRESTLNILGATSGDTGSAAIHGVRGRDNINIFIMHPQGRVSPIQEKQMTSVLDANVFNIAITGTFDDGQRVLKEIFGDLPFKESYNLGAVNSVNWARLLAQIVYYFYGAFRVCERTGAEKIQVSVPTGNFGDIFAGYLARKMGAPIRRLILATNANDILARFFNTGVYEQSSVQPTLSPSMDIQVASNFERYLYYRVGEDPERVKTLMAEFVQKRRIEMGGGADPVFVAGTCSENRTLQTIRRTYADFDYVLDPHTAVGVAVAEEYADPDAPTLALATAHPAKFPDAITQAVGRDVAHHPIIDKLDGLPTREKVLPADKKAVQDYIIKVLSSGNPHVKR